MPRGKRKAPPQAVIIAGVEATSLGWRRLRFVFSLAIPLLYLAFVVTVTLLVGTTEVPSPHDRFGPYAQVVPWARGVLAGVVTLAAAMLWGLRSRLVDMPVSDLAAARPGLWTYRGRVEAVDSPADDPRSVTLVAPGDQRAVRARLTDATASVWIGAEAIALGLFCSRTEYRYHLGDLVTVSGWCGIAENGELVLGEHPSIRRGSFPVRRRWLALLGDGRAAIVGLTSLALSAGLTAVALWVSLFTVETWETGSRFSGGTASAIVFREGASTYLVWSLVGAAMAVGLAWLISIVNRLVRLRGQAKYAASIVQVAEVERREALEQLAAVTSAAIDHAATIADLDLPVASGQVSEATPVLAADMAVAHLQRSIIGYENRIASARRFHIDAVQAHDDLERIWPHRWVARLVPVPKIQPPLAGS